MAAMWQIIKNTSIALDKDIKDARDIPYTISYVIRKMILIDSLNELPREKRPPYKLIFEGTSKELDEWIEGAMKGIKQDSVIINIDEVE